MGLSQPYDSEHADKAHCAVWFTGVKGIDSFWRPGLADMHYPTPVPLL